MHSDSTRRRHGARVAAVVAATLVLTAAPVTAAHAATTAGVLNGKVMHSGKPLAGATVTLTVMQGLGAPEGPYRQQPVATAVTSSVGAFSLPLQAVPAVLDAAAANGGYVNYAVQAFYDRPATVRPDAQTAAVVTAFLHALAAINPGDVAAAVQQQSKASGGTLPATSLTALADLVFTGVVGSPPNTDAYLRYVYDLGNSVVRSAYEAAMKAGSDVSDLLSKYALVRTALSRLAAYGGGSDDDGTRTNIVPDLGPTIDAVNGAVAALIGALPDYKPFVDRGVAEVDALLASDPTLTELRVEGVALTAADLAYTTVRDTGVLAPGQDVVAAVLATPDPVTLETTVTARLDSASAPGGVDGLAHEDCGSMYAPLVTVEQHEHDLAPVGEAHAMYDMTVDFEYGVHANTDLNGAYSFSGGPFKTTGSANHMGNKKTMTGGTYGPREARVGQTMFSYRLERLDFTDDDGDGHICRTDHRVIPEGWVGGGWQNGADVSGSDSYAQMDAARGKHWAVVFDKRSHWTKETSKGHKYHSGVEAFGISLYAESSWSDQVNLDYTFGTATTDHWLYGSNGTIADAEKVFAW